MRSTSGRTTRLAAEVVHHGAQIGEQELFERIIHRIHQFFLKLLWDPSDAEECLQETLILLERSLREKKYDPTCSFNTWIWIKARTAYAQWCRTRSRRVPTDALPDGLTSQAGSEYSADDRLDAITILREVERQVGPEAYEAFVLFYEGGLTRGEVAEVLGRDVKTVRKRINKAHDLIRKLVE